MSHILNQLILQRIDQNDDTLTHFRIGHGHIFTLKPAEAEFTSCVNNNYTRLGNAIATNTHINILEIGLVENPLNITNRKFFDGIKQNSSIHHLSLCCGDTDQQHVLVDGVGHTAGQKLKFCDQGVHVRARHGASTVLNIPKQRCHWNGLMAAWTR